MRKHTLEITWETTPAQLRVIAGALEKEGCNQVRVNWYHTILCFCLPEKPPVGPPVFNLEGEKDGTIPVGDIK